GPIGLSALQFVLAVGAQVAVMDRDAHRLEFCRRQLCIAHALDGMGDVPAQLRKCFGGDLPTAVIDATGNQQSMTTAFSYPCHGGRLVFVGIFPGALTFNDPDFHRRELTLLASRNATVADFDRIIGLMEDGTIDTSTWITHRAVGGMMIDEFTRW